MDLSKVFDCIFHDLLIARLHTYGSKLDIVTLSMKRKKKEEKNVEINGICSTLLTILFLGVNQG